MTGFHFFSVPVLFSVTPFLHEMNATKQISVHVENGSSIFQLNLSTTEIGLLIDMLNSVSDPRAAPLRQTIEKHIRSNVLFDLWIDKSIILCNNCSGSGQVKYWEDFLEEYITAPCSKCKTSGRLVQFTSVRHEPLSPIWKDQLARLY